jgi:hypothetical protein
MIAAVCCLLPNACSTEPESVCKSARTRGHSRSLNRSVSTNRHETNHPATDLSEARELEALHIIGAVQVVLVQREVAKRCQACQCWAQCHCHPGLRNVSHRKA